MNEIIKILTCDVKTILNIFLKKIKDWIGMRNKGITEDSYKVLDLNNWKDEIH